MSPPRPSRVLLLLVLLTCGAASPGDGQDLARRLTEVEARLEIERKSWVQAWAGATSDAERAELVAAFPRDDFAAELKSIANEAKGTDVAARAWMDLARIGRMLEDRALLPEAIERLVADHAASREAGSVMSLVCYGAPSWTAPIGVDALRKIMAVHPDPAIKQECLAELAMMLGTEEVFGEAGLKEAEALLDRLEKECADVEFNAMNGRQFATGARNEIRALRVGQVAPDFEITDQDGVRFKLSDYRGRVVVLDFWGFV